MRIPFSLFSEVSGADGDKTFLSIKILRDNRHNCQVAEYKDKGSGRRDTEDSRNANHCRPRAIEPLGLGD